MGVEIISMAEPIPMKSLLSILLLTGFVIAACEEEPPPRARHQAARYPATEPAPYPPEQQPFNPNAPSSPTPAPESVPMPTPTAAPARTTAKGDHPYGIPVPGKPHVVESPFSPGKYVDVEGFPPGTEVKDPYTGKIFLVP